MRHCAEDGSSLLAHSQVEVLKKNWVLTQYTMSLLINSIRFLPSSAVETSCKKGEKEQKRELKDNYKMSGDLF